MNQIVVGVSDLKVSNNVEDILVTYALGSCVAVIVYDARVKVGGMLHFMLPDSSIDKDKAMQNPVMFADTGVPLLFKSCYKLGAEKRRMIVKIAGGAKILDDDNRFQIGRKNITSLRRIFWRNNVMIDGGDIGENHNRTAQLYISTGRVIVKTPGGVMKEL